MTLDREQLALAARELADSVAKGYSPTDVSRLEQFAKEIEDYVVEWSEFVEKHSDQDPNVLTRIVKYISRVHAIPVIGAEFRWFMATFDVLRELVAPNSGAARDDALLYLELQKGILAAQLEIAFDAEGVE